MSIRLNPNPLPDLLASIQQSEANQETATQQLSTGKSVNQISDNPAAAASVVQNHNQASQDSEYLQSIDSLQGRFQVADSALSNVVTVLTRALSLGVEGANGTLNAGDQQAIASEVQGLLNQTVSLGNTNYQGAYLFGGTAVNTLPFTLNTTTNTVTYNGNANTTSVQLSAGVSVAGNVPGSQLFQNVGGSALGALQDLYAALNTGTNIPAAVTEIQSALSQVDVQRVTYGNALNQITLSQNFLAQDKINLSTQENALVGVDPSVAATDFSQAQVAEQATLSATAKVLSLPTLLDFLR